MTDRMRAGVRAAALPLSGFAATYLLLVILPQGRQLDLTAVHGRFAAFGSRVREGDQLMLNLVSAPTLLLALGVLAMVAVWRGRWRIGVLSVAAVAGALASTEVLKYVLPSKQEWNTHWHWLTLSSFPSGHSIIVTSLALGALSVSAPRWRRWLLGPLAAWVVVTITATVTLGWHSPGDVIGSLFLASAWHRALLAGEPAQLGLSQLGLSELALAGRAEPVAAPVWSGVCAVTSWFLASALVVGTAIKALVSDPFIRPPRPPWMWSGLPAPELSRFAGPAFAGSLGVLAAGAGVTLLLAYRAGRAPAGPDRGTPGEATPISDSGGTFVQDHPEGVLAR